MAGHHASIETKLAEYFTQSSGKADPTLSYTDADIQQISSLVEFSNSARSRAPRMYIILRLIDNLDLLDGLLQSGFNDHWLPVASARTLPSSWGPDVKAKFLRTQPVVLTKSIDLEKGDEGKHRHFSRNEDLPFVVKTILGRGGSGQVDRVLSRISFKEYARKRIRRTHIFGDAKLNMKIYTNELEALKRLKHRHIVQLVGSYTDPLYLGLIMSPIADCDLAQFLSSVPSSPDKLPLLRSFFGCLASAITFLHLAEIRHMDLKPQNFLCKEGSILVTDFGLARDLMDTTQQTTVGTVLGISPPYCAPEVAESEPRDYSADIWSLGCVFLEMLSVLKGKTIDEMREYFEGCGSRKRYIRNNLEGVQEWSSVLRKAQLSTDNAVLDWIPLMLRYDRRQRINAETLYETIRDPLGRPEFCGICCSEISDGVPSEDDENEDDGREDDLEGVGNIREGVNVMSVSTDYMSIDSGPQSSRCKIIVGLHYGASFSSLSYLLASDHSVLEDIHVLRDWPMNRGWNYSWVPSTIAYPIENGNKIDRITWGNEVVPDLVSCSYTKLLIDDSILPDSMDHEECRLPKGKSAQEVCEDYLHELYQFLLVQTLERNFVSDYLQICSMEVWMTFPSAWSDRGRQSLKAAAYAAGFGSPVGDSLHLIPESEAFLVGSEIPYSLDEVVLFCDCKRLTVEVHAYRVIAVDPMLKFEEIHTAMGGNCGSRAVDINFESWLETTFGRAYTTVSMRERGPGSTFRTSFESAKRIFGDPIKRRDTFEIEPIIMDVPSSTHYTVGRYVVEVTSSEMEGFFEPVTRRILDLVEQQATQVKARTSRTPDRLILVGGFGNSAFLQMKLKNWCSHNSVKHFEYPYDYHYLVSQGAAFHGLKNRNEVSSRVTTRHYGVVQDALMKEGTDDYHTNFVDPVDGRKYCPGRMTWIISMGQEVQPPCFCSVDLRATFKHSNDTHLQPSLTLYSCSLATAPEWVHDSGVEELCDIAFDLSRVVAENSERINDTESSLQDSCCRVDYTIEIGFWGVGGGLKGRWKAYGKDYGEVVLIESEKSEQCVIQ